MSKGRRNRQIRRQAQGNKNVARNMRKKMFRGMPVSLVRQILSNRPN